MKKVLLLVLPLPFLLSGCIDDVARAGLAVHKVHEERNNNPESYMTYFQDKNTKLCFASLDMPTITNVPCTEEVLKAISDKDKNQVNIGNVINKEVFDQARQSNNENKTEVKSKTNPMDSNIANSVANVKQSNEK